MGIIIREYLGENNLANTKGASNFNLKEYSNSGPIGLSENSIMVDIEAIHEYPFSTRNYTRYMREALVGSIPSWTKPYLKPLIMHHNDTDGKIIGRIHHAEYEDKNTFSGAGALTLTANIPESDGQRQVEDGRLMTASIGVLAHDVRCSICNHNIAQDGECEHERGRVYNQEICYWDIYEMEGKELSYVIVPSDMYSKNKKIYKPSTKQLRESLEVTIKEGFEVDKNKEIDSKESTTIDELIPEEEKKKSEIVAENPDDQKLIDDLEEIKNELNDIKQDLKNTIIELSQEKDLRESLEEEIKAYKKQERKAVETEFNSLRESLGKEQLAQDVLSKRTNESLTDSICDMRLDVKSATKIEVDEAVDTKEEVLEIQEKKKVTKIESPTLEEKDTKNEEDLSEANIEKEYEDMDLSEEVEKLFSGVLSSKL